METTKIPRMTTAMANNDDNDDKDNDGKDALMA